MPNLSARSSRRTSKNRPQATSRTRRRSFFETLENRSLLATLTWDGGGAADNFNDPLNWDNAGANQLPVANDTLVFSGIAPATITNDIAAGTTFALQFTAGGYTITGNSINLNQTATATAFGIQDTTGGNAINTPLTLGNAGSNTVDVGAGTLTLGGVISNGAGNSLTKIGAGTLVHTGANTYTGPTVISAGTLVATTAASLGAAAAQLNLNGGNLTIRSNAAINFGAKPVLISADATFTAQRPTAGAGVAHAFGTFTAGSSTVVFTNDGSVTSGDAAFDFNGLFTMTGNPVIDTVKPNGTRVLPRFNQGLTDGGVARTLTFNNTSTNTAEEAVVIIGARNLLATTQIDLVGTRAFRLVLQDLSATDSSRVRLANTGGGVLDLRSNSAGTFNNSLIVDANGELRQSRVSGGAALTFGFGAITFNSAASLLVAGNGNLTANTPYQFNVPSVTLGANGTININNNGTGVGTLNVAGAVSETGGARDFIKGGAGTLLLNGVASYTGTTVIDRGIVVYGVDQTLTGGLTFGAANASANVGTLDLSAANASFGGALTVRTNTATANTITVGNTKTLSVAGGMTLGYDAGGGTGATRSNLTVSGLGAMNVTGTTVTISANQAATNAGYWSTAILDVSGLASFNANVTNFNVGVGTNTTGVGTLISSNTSNTIAATTLQVGHSNGNNGNGNSLLTLGTGANFLRADTINLGLSKVGGKIAFASQAAGSPGTVTITNKAGAGAANMTIGSHNGTGTAAVFLSSLDLRGHVATVSAGTITVGNTNTSATGAASGEILFDAGNFTVATLNLGQKSSTGVNPSPNTALLSVGGGTFTVTGTTTVAANSATAGTGSVTGTINVSGGTLALAALNAGVKSGAGTGAGTAIINVTGGALTTSGAVALGSSTASGSAVGTLTISGGTMAVAGNLTLANATVATATATGTLNLNGGVLQVNGNIQRGATTGNESGTVNFNGGTLRAGANNATWVQNLTAANVQAGGAIIDSNGFNVTINQQLLDAGGGLTKEGAGTLTITAANQYTGDTNVNGGTLALQGGAAILDTAGPVNVALGGTLQLNTSETVSSYNGTGDLVGANDSTLALGANTLTTTGNVAIANVTTAAGGGIISGGNITDTDDDNNVTGPNVYLQAATGIGSAANAIETAVGSIQLNNTTSGDINVLNSNAGALLTVADLRTLGFGSNNNGNATTIINSSPLTVAAPVISAGPVLIEARDNGSVVNADFNTSDGGFTVVNGGPVEDPWTYNAATGKWLTNGTQGQGVPSFSELNSASSTVTVSGNVSLSFRHRYSFEFDGTRWDGGQVRISVNGGAFTTVPAGAFSANGYIGVITGNNILNGQDAFNGDSPGYGAGGFITSVANLGAFNAGDTIRVQFVGAWDEFAEGTNPNWEIDSVSVFTPSAVAGDDLTINATVQSTGSSVTLNAGDNLAVNAAVTSATVTAMNVDSGNSDAGVGGNLTIGAAITTPAVGSGGGAFLAGSTDNDTFTFNPQTTTEFRLFGDDPLGTPTGDTLVMDVSGTTDPTLTIPGTTAPYNGLGSGAWSFTSAHQPVLFGSIEQSTITGQHHVIYDNSVSPVANLVVMRDSALPTANVQLRDGSTAGPIVYQGTMSQILSLTINGSGGDDTVTVDDINTLPDFGGTVPGVTDNLNLAGTAELLFDGLGGTDTLVYNINGTTASQSYAIGDGTGAAGLEGEVQSVAAGVTLNAYFQNVELAQRTGVGASQQGLTIIGDASDNNFSTADNAGATRTTITGYTPFDFSGNNYNAVTINALGGADTIDLVNLGTAQSNNPAINLNGGTEDDTIRVRSTIGAVGNTGLVSLNGGLGSDTFLLYDGGNTVDNITGPVDVDGADGNVGGTTDTLIIVDSGDPTADTNVVIAAVSPGLSDDYYVDGVNGVVSSDVVLRNIDSLDYTSTTGDDTIDGRFVSTVNGHDLTTVSLSGWLGEDQFRLFTSDQIGGTGPNNTPSGVASGVASINLYGDALGNPNPGDGEDTFGDSPPAPFTGTGATNVGLEVSSDTRMIRPSVTTSITIDGGAPTGLAAPLGDVAGDVLNVNISDLPNTTPVIVSTFGPGTVVAPGISPLVWSEIEDINVVDQNKLTNVQMGDLFGRTTPNPDFVQITRDPTLTNPNRVRLRITATIGNYSVSNKTIIYGGGMNDTITQANLTVPAEFYGEDGDDYLSGAMNNDWLVGGLGHDRINGSGGDNVIWGDNSPTNPGDLTPQDGADGGNDQLSGLGGNDVFYGGAGNDLVSGGGGNDYAYGGQGNDTLDGNDGDDRLYGGVGNDVLGGHAGNDLLTGGDGDDSLYGGDGNDVIFGGFGVDHIDGGAGNDLLVTGRVTNENSSWTSVANTTTFSPATYTLGGDNDAALLILLNQWAATSDPLLGPSLAITHDGLNDEVYGSTGDDDFCWEAADVVENFPGTTPRDYNAVGMGTDERFGPT